MTRALTVFTVLLLGCGGRVSLGEHGGRNDEIMIGSPGDAAGTTDTGGSDTAGTSELAFIHLDDSAWAGTTRWIRIDAACRVTDHSGMNATADATQCKQLFDGALSGVSSRGEPIYEKCMFRTEGMIVTIGLADGRTLRYDSTRSWDDLPSICTISETSLSIWSMAGGT